MEKILIPEETREMLREFALRANTAIREHEIIMVATKRALSVPDGWQPNAEGSAFAEPPAQIQMEEETE